MIIKEIQLAQLTIPLIRPFITAIRRTDCVDDVVVMIKTDKGTVGYGSAASTPAITGDSKESIIKAIQQVLGPQLIGRSILELNSLLEMNDQSLMKNNSAKAALDMALHDLFAQNCGLPLYRLLGGNKNSIHSCITLSVKAKEDMVQDALELVSQGHHTLKIKLGLDPAEDIQRVCAVRQAVGEEVALLVDANQGWSYENALKVIHAFGQQHLNINWVEQPVLASDRSSLKELTSQVDCSIIADEACFSPEDALELAKNKACDGVNIKLMKAGGLKKAQAIYHIVRAAQMDVMVGCMLESPIGVAAMASFALSQPAVVCADLDPVYLIRDNYISGGLQCRGNELILSDKPGLGIEGISQGLSLVGVIT